MLDLCPACKTRALFLVEAVYDGFRKIGESRRCTSCGHVVAAAGAPKAPAPKRHSLFDEADAEAAPAIFDLSETERLCRKCRHYVVNPFKQRCMLHLRDVEATDTCEQFDAP
jgi:hypothetical protein